MHDNIFDLVTHGQGGWNWKDVYTMPIHLRNYYLSKLDKYVSDKAKAANPSSKKKGK